MIKRNNFRQRLKFFRNLVSVIFLLILAVAAIIIFCNMDDSVTGRGVVRGAREYELKSTQMSRVAKIYKRDGENVVAGELLLELNDQAYQEELAILQDQIRELAAEIEVKEAEFALLKHDPLPAEYRHTKIALDESTRRVQNSLYERDTSRVLFEKKVISEMEMRKREMKYEQDVADLNKLKNDFQKLQSGLEQKILNRAESEIKMMRIKLSAKQNRLALIKEKLKEYQFYAPESGVITYIPSKLGTYVEPGQIVVALAVTSGNKKFLAYVDEQQIYKIKEGQRVRITSSQYNYFEHGYFLGKVYAIDELPELRGSAMCYGVRIIIEDEPQPLRLGSTGEAEIIVGEDRIVNVLFNLR
ncbi:MAG: HlyD family efflux transporter periplasmic adaptor subunit [Victivallaceae bacterium]